MPNSEIIRLIKKTLPSRSYPIDFREMEDGDTFEAFTDSKWRCIIRELYRIFAKGGVVVWNVADATKDGSEAATDAAMYFRGKLETESAPSIEGLNLGKIIAYATAASIAEAFLDDLDNLDSFEDYFDERYCDIDESMFAEDFPSTIVHDRFCC